MAETENLARILAVMRVKNRAVPQPDRVQLMLEVGAERAFEHIVDGDLFAGDEVLDACRLEVASWMHRGIRVVSLFDDDYPQRLLSVREAPALLFYTGQIDPNDEAVAIVGSRSAGPGAREAARKIAHIVGTRHGLSIASGLAKGIDAAAHLGAHDARVRTVAVMGTPIDTTFPEEHTALREYIEASNGLVLSQFLPGTSPGKHTFPMRNITMSGYSLATIVVAATEHSGTRHQAKAALAHSRNVILLPGVIEDTTWAKDMAHTSGVFVASSLDEVSRAIETIQYNRQLLAGALPA